jgi:hypothetical protein
MKICPSSGSRPSRPVPRLALLILASFIFPVGCRLSGPASLQSPFAPPSWVVNDVQKRRVDQVDVDANVDADDAGAPGPYIVVVVAVVVAEADACLSFNAV